MAIAKLTVNDVADYLNEDATPTAIHVDENKVVRMGYQNGTVHVISPSSNTRALQAHEGAVTGIYNALTVGADRVIRRWDYTKSKSPLEEVKIQCLIGRLVPVDGCKGEVLEGYAPNGKAVQIRCDRKGKMQVTYGNHLAKERIEASFLREVEAWDDRFKGRSRTVPQIGWRPQTALTIHRNRFGLEIAAFLNEYRRRFGAIPGPVTALYLLDPDALLVGFEGGKIELWRDRQLVRSFTSVKSDYVVDIVGLGESGEQKRFAAAFSNKKLCAFHIDLPKRPIRTFLLEKPPVAIVDGRKGPHILLSEGGSMQAFDHGTMERLDGEKVNFSDELEEERAHRLHFYRMRLKKSLAKKKRALRVSR